MDGGAPDRIGRLAESLTPPRHAVSVSAPKSERTNGMTPDTDTTNPLLSCLDEISPVLFIVIWVGALIAGWILQRHNNLDLKQTYRAMTGRLKVPRPTAFYVVTAVWVVGTFGYFAYAYQAVCTLSSG